MKNKEQAEIQKIVEELISNNRQRKKAQEDTYYECEKIIIENHIEDLFFIVNCPNAHEGISGIVAGKIKDKYNKPTIILTPSGEGYLKGTGRSIKNINLYNILKEKEDYFERFGGHAGACGLLMKMENLKEFRDSISVSMEEMLETNPNIFEDDTEVDIFLKGKDLNFELIYNLEKLAPFGNSNEKPYMALTEVTIRKLQYMGNEGKHVRFSAYCNDGSVIQCVLFNKAAELKNKLTYQGEVTLLGSPDISEWKGNKKIQFLVNDMQ